MRCNHTFIFRIPETNQRICGRCKISMALGNDGWVPEVATRTSAYNLEARDLAKELVEIRRAIARCQGLLETSVRLGRLVNPVEFAERLDYAHGAVQHHITRLALLPREEATS